MKSVMLSIQPKWCDLIAIGKKTIEVRKTKPKLETPFKCYIYCTKDNKSEKANGKVVGEFVCDYILKFTLDSYGHHEYFVSDDDLKASCLTVNDLWKYANGKTLYGWHISDLVIYDEPKKLGEFKKINRECWYADLGLAKRDCPECKNEKCFLSRPPQSWCYVEK